jgi:hypothetical protein
MAVKAATPDEFNVAVPSCVVPSKKVTAPVGKLDPEAGATVAVSVTACPEVTCVGEAESAVVLLVFAGATMVTVAAAEVDVLKLESPP